MKCHVTYKIPTYDELEKQFDWVWDKHETAKFERHETCKNIDEKDGEREFEYVCTDGASEEEVLAEIEEQGYRPATFEELVSFAAAYPEEQKKYLIVALGSSFADFAGGRYVPHLHWSGGGGNLGAGRVDNGWYSGARFLVVRKVSTGNSDSISRELLIRACKAFVSVLEEGNKTV